MSKHIVFTLAALGALSAVALLAPPVHAAGQSGMVVVRDPKTGQLRPPTAAESQALLGKSADQRKAPPHVAGIGPGGSRKVQLGKSAMVYSVARKNPDGTFTEQCVSSEHAAHAAIADKTRITPATPAKETRHESE